MLSAFWLRYKAESVPPSMGASLPLADWTFGPTRWDSHVQDHLRAQILPRYLIPARGGHCTPESVSTLMYAWDAFESVKKNSLAAEDWTYTNTFLPGCSPGRRHRGRRHCFLFLMYYTKGYERFPHMLWRHEFAAKGTLENEQLTRGRSWSARLTEGI